MLNCVRKLMKNKNQKKRLEKAANLKSNCERSNNLTTTETTDSLLLCSLVQ
jgi:hypothetical protein